MMKGRQMTASSDAVKGGDWVMAWRCSEGGGVYAGRGWQGERRPYVDVSHVERRMKEG